MKGADAQMELALPPPLTSLEAWMKSHNPRKEALRRHDKDEDPYNPRTLRKWLLTYLTTTEWKGFIDLADECGQSSDAASRVLDLLEGLGRIEKTPLYFYPWSDLVQADRTIHPGYGKQYQGFEFGYRLNEKGLKP
ncbi:MAG: hypothetical protein K9N47_21185 [Prosthecobacter sp.]|uniref:hypothetical protein n=1 Tax=Prosthecobacter sp. TaxID=1965333 RepID=UPI002612A4F3|nr:hypothetical protein [Prosthecobacter sp.]MCF7788651.1 hypothetical protein [Prosthecobacter sp.]